MNTVMNFTVPCILCNALFGILALVVYKTALFSRNNYFSYCGKEKIVFLERVIQRTVCK